jgi:hypothetical protein
MAFRYGELGRRNLYHLIDPIFLLAFLSPASCIMDTLAPPVEVAFQIRHQILVRDLPESFPTNAGNGLVPLNVLTFEN